MIEFTIGLAGQAVKVRANYESTRNFCRGYLTANEPDFSVEISRDDIVYERQKSAKEDALEGIPAREFSDAYLETLAVYRKITEEMLHRNTLLFHGSVIAVDGEAFLFTAKSGTGKSTHTRLWREVFGDRAVMVNDDKPLLKICEDGVEVFGTPWNGKHHLGANISAPLKAICILERGTENQIREITPREAFPMLLQQSYRLADAGGMNSVLDLLDRLTQRCAFYRLQCNMDRQAALISYGAMSGNNHVEV